MIILRTSSRSISAQSATRPSLLLIFMMRMFPFHVKWYAGVNVQRTQSLKLARHSCSSRIRRMSAVSVHVLAKERLCDAVYNLFDFCHQNLDNKYEQPSSRFHSCPGRDCPCGLQRGEQKRPLDSLHCMGKIFCIGFQTSNHCQPKNCSNILTVYLVMRVC